MSPDRLQHLFDFMLGGLGRFGTDAADTVQKTVIPEAESLESSDVPIWRNFVFNPSEYNDQFRYYDNRADMKREMELWENSNEQTRDSLVTKRSREFYKQLPMKLKSSDKILRSNRKEIRRIEGLDASGRIANADKLARLKTANDLIYDRVFMSKLIWMAMASLLMLRLTQDVSLWIWRSLKKKLIASAVWLGRRLYRLWSLLRSWFRQQSQSLE